MSDTPFHATVMGRRYYEHTAPELVRQLTRVADALERLIETQHSQKPAAEPANTNDEESHVPTHHQEARPAE